MDGREVKIIIQGLPILSFVFTFPQLSSAEGADEWGTQWMEAIEADLADVLAHFEIRYSEDLGALEATLEQFRTDGLEDMTEEQLTQQFIHLWLMKVDRLVMHGDGGYGYRPREDSDHDG